MHAETSMIVVGLASLCVLLLLFSIIRHYTRNSFLPADAWILIIGIIYGVVLRKFDIDFLPRFSLDPEIVILLFLPLLIFASGRLVNPSNLKSEAVFIGFFSIIGVVATGMMIGLPIAWILDIHWLHGLLIGAAAAATDPAAVGSIFKHFQIPERLDVMLEGESLFNDGSTVVLFALVAGLLLMNDTFYITASVSAFAWAIIGALLLGCILGWLAARLLILWKEVTVFYEISMTLIVTYTAFLLAEEVLHVSGVIAVLLAAIFLFKTLRENTAYAIQQSEHVQNNHVMSEFWDYLSLVINSIIFFSLGASTGLHDFSEVPTEAVLVAIAALIIARCILVYGGSGLLAICRKRPPLVWQNVLVLGGLRGAISAALILTIPHDYSHRGTFLCLAFAMIAFTLIVQPLLLKPYLKKVNFENES